MKLTKPKNKVLVIGDIMLDSFCKGTVGRISPEAPVPVVKIEGQFYRAGGAANVAGNIAALGAETALLGVIGKDRYGEELCRHLADMKINYDYLIKSQFTRTNTKVRVIGNHQQIVRLDYHDGEKIDDREIEKLILTVHEIVGKYDVVVLSDYNKGICSERLCSKVLEICNSIGKPVLVDPKGTNWEKYAGARMLTPNLKEISEYLGCVLNNNSIQLEENCRDICKKTKTDYVLITRSENGMTLINRKNNNFTISADAKEVFDVSGAGDTVIATIATFFGCRPLTEVVKLANTAAGIVVGKQGTAVVTLEEIESILDREQISKIVGKIVTLEELMKRCAQWKANGETVVFTNGCFDVFHKGHAFSIYSAAEFGDRLIVAINSDMSVKRLKGDERPINNQYDRAYVIASMGCVDAVIVFNEDTPEELLKHIRPDVLVKGGDYKIDEVIGREFADKVELIKYIEGYSSTKLIERMKSATEERDV